MGYTCSVVIPVYNSQGTLRELVTRLAKVMPQLCETYEVILVNDGSRDQSWQEICALATEYPWTRGINMMRNYGQHNALLCGLRAAKYELTITMDDDLQHPPEEIGILLEKFCDDFDVVYGLPKKLPHSLWRNFFSLLTKRLLAFVTNIPSVRYSGSFRVLRTELREAFATFQSPNVILDVLLSWGTTRFTYVRVEESPREVGSSNYNFLKLFSHAMSILIGFSTAPLRLASMIGFAFTILGIIIFAYVIILFFVAGSIPGFPFLASIISLFSGTQLFALGIFGEYLATVFDRSMERPVYMVREVTGTGETH
jgi:glycosyltransferase involved in cell wall biosynthesis